MSLTVTDGFVLSVECDQCGEPAEKWCRTSSDGYAKRLHHLRWKTARRRGLIPSEAGDAT